ncbi:hypothetical protein [Mucisphaera sp.]|uniref:hypothetical protein n=1 Tax=Mucisphaera sp. TaxID=2913024 RepID=UPI003D11123E
MSLTLCAIAGCQAPAHTPAPQPQQSPHAAAQPPGTGHPPDAPIADWQTELLDLSFEAASRMPIVIHLKNRSRAQYRVIQAALQLDQPSRALTYSQGIDNWQRGAAAADYALYAATQGHADPIDQQLLIAEATAKLATQDWQRQYIDMIAARTQLVLGQQQAAREFRNQPIDNLYEGALDITEASLSTNDAFDQIVARLDTLLASQRYEAIINGAQAYAELFGKHYKNTERRALIEDKLRAAYQHMPGPETIDLLLSLSRVAIDHNDHDTASRLLDDAQQITEQAAWPTGTQYRYQFVSRIAQARHDIHQTSTAHQLLQQLIDQYNQDEEQIVNITRADAIRAIAEGYARLGEKDQARNLYLRALEQGFVNPNSRPRADDLIDTCLSMAAANVEPNDEIWQRVRDQHARLGPPW